MSADLTVVGGGVIGLAIAWRCAQRGLSVVVHDPEPGRGASHVAAGMLAPISEAYFGESALTTLLLDSSMRWPGFAADLSPFGDVGFRDQGTLMVALTSDDLSEAERLWRYHTSLGLSVTTLSGALLREREPALHPRVRGGALARTDYQADPRKLVAALRSAAEAQGVRITPVPVTDLTDLDSTTVVVAAGCGSTALTGLPVRPVKGQVLRLRARDGRGGSRPATGAGPSWQGGSGFQHVVRGWADGRRVYLVPRVDGEVVVGASEEERTDLVPTAGVALELLRAATDLVPELTEYELAEINVGHRPGTPDNAPILGTLRSGIVVATGHYRHGVMLAPVTADTISELVVSGQTPDLIAPFTPSRFPEVVAMTGTHRPPAGGRRL